MKTIIALAMLAFVSNSFAWTSHDQNSKEYVFKFKLAGQSLELKEQAASYEDAYAQAAKQCFKFFKGKNSLNEERGLDIIDVCANPRS